MPLQLDEKVKALGSRAQAQLTEQFARIDAIAQENTARVLAAFQEHRVAESYFSGTTGYGYDDLGRDKLDEIYAQLFGTEAALVRLQFVNGTHAITAALFGALKAGDVLFTGDTLFCGSCGRTDFAGGDPKAMLASLDRLAALPGNYKVYPGHEGATELDYERRVNPFMTRRLSL